MIFHTLKVKLDWLLLQFNTKEHLLSLRLAVFHYYFDNQTGRSITQSSIVQVGI